MPASRLAPGGCQWLMRGTRTTNPHKPNTTDGMPARSSMNREYNEENRGGAYHSQKRAEQKPRGPARRIAPMVASKVPMMMGNRLNESSTGCQEESSMNRLTPRCRSAGIDSKTKNMTMKTRIRPAILAQPHSAQRRSWSRCKGDEIMLSDQIINVRRGGKRNKGLSQC